MTRAFKNRAESHNISVDSTVKIVRHLGLEKSVIQNPAAKIIDRRVTVNTYRPTLKKVKNIPFGARGRKRQTLNLAFFGLQVNPDGRKLLIPARTVADASVTGPSVADASVTCPSVADASVTGPSFADASVAVTPGRRTYSRATSTPLPTTSAHPQPSLAELQNNLDVSSRDAEDVTFEALFDSLGFGNLHYSSSE